MTQGRGGGVAFEGLKKFTIYYYYYANYIQNILFTTMRPGITFLAALKVHGNKVTPITVLKQHGREGHIPLDPSKFESVLLSCDMYTT